jgi:hypothetical protein
MYVHTYIHSLICCFFYHLLRTLNFATLRAFFVSAGPPLYILRSEREYKKSDLISSSSIYQQVTKGIRVGQQKCKCNKHSGANQRPRIKSYSECPS